MYIIYILYYRNKRKLSVAVALIGRPSILFLDEPTTGMDPKARRFLWDLISATVRDGRTVILTSHSMEECDALCSRLAIMVNGNFKCLGSPQLVKSTYGNGYTLIMKITGSEPNVNSAMDFINSSFPGAILKEQHHGYIVYQLSSENLPPLSAIFDKLEGVRKDLNLEDYSLSQTSLDTIFCNFAAEQYSDREQSETDLDTNNHISNGIMDSGKRDPYTEIPSLCDSTSRSFLQFSEV